MSELGRAIHYGLVGALILVGLYALAIGLIRR